MEDIILWSFEIFVIFSNFLRFLIFSTQKMKFSIKDFFSKCDQIRRKLRIWSNLLKKILNGKLHFLSSVFRHMATPEATRIYQFITNNHALFHLWWKENLLNHQKFSEFMKMVVDSFASISSTHPSRALLSTCFWNSYDFHTRFSRLRSTISFIMRNFLVLQFLVDDSVDFLELPMFINATLSETYYVMIQFFWIIK